MSVFSPSRLAEQAQPFSRNPGTANISCADVIVAAWNREATIGRAVRSILADRAVRSVIVIDDASTDATLAEAKRGCDGSGRLILHRLNGNRGPAAARNAGLPMSDAPWIAVVDADDYLLPGRITALLALAEGWDFVADDILQIQADSAGTAQPEAMLSREPFEPWACSLEAFVLGNISVPGRFRKELGFFKPLIRRAFLEKHDLRYDEELRLGEDYAIYARALALGARFLVTPAHGYVSVNRGDSLSARHTKSDLEKLRDSDLELSKLPGLSRRQRRAIQKHYHSVDARIQWLNVIDSVKERNVILFLKAALRSKQSALFVLARLWEQLLIRCSR